ncbi:oligosaccharide flippase family protein, partial [bacterium]|nr:oligosaccharide flippase family protein [bacterium]
MINKLKSLTNTDDKKRLMSNFFSLSLLQMMNYLLPLLVIPYLFTTLGSEKFGLIAFAQAVVTYFSLFVNYGFNLSATREISIHRDNTKKVSEIFSTVTTIKVIFLFTAFCIFNLIIYYVDKFSGDWKLYLFTFGMIIESILFPMWFFQGMERMKFITVIYTFSKIIVTVLIFMLIKGPDDYLMVPILYFIGSIISGALSIYVLFKLFQVYFIIPSFNQIIFQLQDGWHLFISNATINMYRNANILILGLMTTSIYVGYYALVEKVIRALQALMAPVSETLYPYIAKKSTNQSLEKSLDGIVKISKYYAGILIILSSCIFLFAPFIVYILSGEKI